MKFQEAFQMLSGAQVTTQEIQGQTRMILLVLELSRMSLWFAVMPLPDDHYEITVREEHADRLRVLIRSIQAGTQ